jgi:hypothetical protein
MPNGKEEIFDNICSEKEKHYTLYIIQYGTSRLYVGNHYSFSKSGLIFLVLSRL